MKFQAIQVPHNVESEYFTIEPLCESDLSAAEALGYKLVVYWYARGDYEGSGYALCTKFERDPDGHLLWDLLEIGHCSCYGPFDCDYREQRVARDRTLIQHAALSSEHLAREIRGLLDVATRVVR